ncbi:MAG: hypothetical protein Q9M20_07230 [Mariprofundaceae bacterium]|nr:hypothetical protein [Mariprofundaceae bacterium]
MQASNLTPLSITRHVIQIIWQTTLAKHDTKISGLLGSQRNNDIDKGVHKPLWQALQTADTPLPVDQKQIHALKVIAQTWKSDHTTLAGVYQCEQPNAMSMQATEKFLAGYFQQQQGMAFIHLYVRFDTDGILESEAWILKDGLAIQVPMQLIEDRQSTRSS